MKNKLLEIDLNEADYDLGLKILKAVQTDGQCEFTAEL